MPKQISKSQISDKFERSHENCKGSDMLTARTKIDMSVSNNITFTAQSVRQVGMDLKIIQPMESAAAPTP